MSSFANRYDRLKHSLSCVFPKPGKWWDYALYLLIVLGFISIKDDLNEWLSLSFGDRLIAFSSYLAGNRFLLWLIVSAFAVGVGYYCSRKLKDQYRSISLFLILLFVLIALSVSKSNWDYVLIVGKVSFFHLIVTGVAAVAISVLVVSPRNKQRKPGINKDEGDSKCFTIDNVKASVAKADKNRTDYAKDLVERILNTRMDEEAFSVGISGEWGSGKSTFLELLKQEFEHDSSGRVSTIVEFHPWDGASSGQIVSDFFNVLVGKLGERYSVVKTPLLKYSDLLSALDAKKPVIFLAGLLDKKRNKSISEVKDIISTFLKQYGKIIPVLIDDLDRLTADEIAEVLKLIRNTADFPNIVYIAAYDKSYVCKQLEKKRLIENSSVYIEKFFSVEFVLPKLDDQYQYEVLAEEIKAMKPYKELLHFVEEMPGGIKRLLCSDFQNFRQVKRFARIFVQDCEFFLRLPNAFRIIEMQDLFLLKMLAFLDIDTYYQLEKNHSSIVYSPVKFSGCYRPFQLRPGVLGEDVNKEERDKAYVGPVLPDSTREILKILFHQPRNGRKKTSIVNPESMPIYFMLNIPSHSITVLEVNRLIAGDEDIEKRFETWREEQKLNSLFHHLMGIEPKKMDENQAKRYLYLCLSLMPHLFRVNEMGEHALKTIHYADGLYDTLSAYVHAELATLIGKASEEVFSRYNGLMKLFVWLYPDQLEAEFNNEEIPTTLLGNRTEIQGLASDVFNSYVSLARPNADDLFRKDSLTRSIVEDAVFSYTDENGEWQGCESLISDAMLAYFRTNKGKDKMTAAHYYDISPDTPPQYENDEMEGKQYEMLHLFGSESTYKAIVNECFEDGKKS